MHQLNRPVTSRRNRSAVLLATLLAVGMIAGCSSSGSSSGSNGGKASSSTANASGKITIPHRFGETVLDGVPKRIVSLDTQWSDILVALHGPLAGAAADPTIPGGRYPWQLDFPKSVTKIEVPKALTIPYEGIAAKNPDLIVATWAVAQKSIYDKLSQIAPTIPPLDNREVETWQQLTTAAGKILQRPEAAKALIASVNAKVDDFAKGLPGLKGKTYAFANYTEGDSFTVVADPKDGSAQLFAKLGMKIDPKLLKLVDHATGRAKLSLENVGKLDADVLILLTNGADPSKIPGYNDLPAVRSGAVALVDYGEATALNTPSPLSIPWVLAKIRPTLVKAAQ